MSKFSPMAQLKPQIGRQITVDPTQAIQKICPCGSDFFKRIYRMKMIPALAPGNMLQKDIPVEFPVYVCVNCGLELGAEKKEKPEGEEGNHG